MRIWLVALLISPLMALSSDFSAQVTSVELSEGLAPLPLAKVFGSLTEAQGFANRNFLDRINLRIHLKLAAKNCAFDIPAISLGYVFDQDLAIFNGQLIGSTGNPELSKRRLSLLPRVYPIPRQLLNCPGENLLDLSLHRILGGWIGPFSGSIEFGELHELQQKALSAEALGPLLHRDIGILLLAISVLLISLFYRYPDNSRQTSFVLFSVSAALLCLSLSSWYYRYFDFPQIIFRLHFAIVSLALTTQVLFIATYRGLAWAERVPKVIIFFGSFLLFLGISFAIPSVTALLRFYLWQILILALLSMAIFLLPIFWSKTFRTG